jgi:putative transposase
MRKRMPAIAESPDELHQRMKSEHDIKKRQRLQALYMVASGHARHRQDLAALLGVHRPSIAVWLDAYAEGGLDAMLHSQVPRPPSRQRITPAALTALQAQLQAPHGLAGYAQIRTWLAEQHQVYLSYSGVYALVRGKLRAKPKRPRPSHAKKVLRLSPSFKQSSQRSSDSRVSPVAQRPQ